MAQQRWWWSCSPFPISPGASQLQQHGAGCADPGPLRGGFGFQHSPSAPHSCFPRGLPAARPYKSRESPPCTPGDVSPWLFALQQSREQLEVLCLGEVKPPLLQMGHPPGPCSSPESQNSTHNSKLQVPVPPCMWDVGIWAQPGWGAPLGIPCVLRSLCASPSAPPCLSFPICRAPSSPTREAQNPIAREMGTDVPTERQWGTKAAQEPKPHGDPRSRWSLLPEGAFCKHTRQYLASPGGHKAIWGPEPALSASSPISQPRPLVQPAEAGWEAQR